MSRESGSPGFIDRLNDFSPGFEERLSTLRPTRRRTPPHLDPSKPPNRPSPMIPNPYPPERWYRANPSPMIPNPYPPERWYRANPSPMIPNPEPGGEWYPAAARTPTTPEFREQLHNLRPRDRTPNDVPPPIFPWEEEAEAAPVDEEEEEEEEPRPGDQYIEASTIGQRVKYLARGARRIAVPGKKEQKGEGRPGRIPKPPRLMAQGARRVITKQKRR